MTFYLLEDFNSIDIFLIVLIILFKILEAIIDLKFNKIETSYEIKIPFKHKMWDFILFWLHWLINLLVFISFYIIVKFLISPSSIIYGISLYVLIIIVVAKPTIIHITDLFYGQKSSLNKSMVFFAISSVNKIFYGFMLFSILMFGFLKNIHLTTAYNTGKLINKEIENINKKNDEISTNITTLNTNLNYIQSTIQITKDNATELKKSLDLLAERKLELAIQKKEIETIIQDLESKTEEEIKNNVMYQLIAKLFQENTLTGFILGIITSLFSSFLFRYLTKVKT